MDKAFSGNYEFKFFVSACKNKNISLQNSTNISIAYGKINGLPPCIPWSCFSSYTFFLPGLHQKTEDQNNQPQLNQDDMLLLADIKLFPVLFSEKQ